MTTAAFAQYRSSSGLNSYELLAGKLSQRAGTVLDLACGDGFLIPLLFRKGADLVIGVDMSDGELTIAREKFVANPQVRLHQGKAQSLPLKDNSVDAIVSHMAFMLMLPVEPVVQEILRVLKSGGQFSAVIGNIGANAEGFLGEIQKVTSKYIARRYPKLRETARAGDLRVKSEAGLKELFSVQKGFRGTLDIFDFSLLVQTDPQGTWDFMKDMYFVSMLPQEDRAEAAAELKEFVSANAQSDGNVEFEFPMRLFTVYKT
jgi:ubiquinone/menaquinone biosynthesis C-methylase UbiE